MQSFYGIDVAGQDGPPTSSTAELLAVFELLKPKAAAAPLIRIGGDADGSYLIPDALAGIAACFSPGVNKIKYFEDFLTDSYGIPCHMCDFSCTEEQFTTPLRPGMQTFVQKWLDVAPGEDNLSLEDWVAEHDVPGDLLLQMDIEGAEYRNLLATSDATLQRFRVVVLEVHGLRAMLDGPVLRQVIAPFFEKLARSFTVVHAHPNNCCGEFTIPGTDVRIPGVLELTFLRTDHFTPGEEPVTLPHRLDVSRNVPSNPPLFLSGAWSDHHRPLESRLKVLEDTVRHGIELGFPSVNAEAAAVLTLTMQSLQTLSELAAPPQSGPEPLEIAAGRPYELSSAYGRSSRRGTVKPRDDYFFHTGFGPEQWIRVDLGRPHRVRRIEITNRGSHQDRAKHLFAVLATDDPADARRVVPLYQEGPLDGGAWQQCRIEIPDLEARWVTITSPVVTALHFADLRIYAAPADHASGTPSRPPAQPLNELVRALRTRARRLPPGPVRNVLARTWRLIDATRRRRLRAGPE